jgi:cell division protein FtsI (penicillin-binding protein 3)
MAAAVSDDNVYKPHKPSMFEISSFRTNRHFYYIMACFVLAYGVLAGKLILYAAGFFKSNEKTKIQLLKPTKARPLILDRNGEVLATDIKKYSVYVEADKLIEKDKAARLLAQALPQYTNQMKLLVEFESGRNFFWVARNINEEERERVFRLGLPGVVFEKENRRFYPNGSLAAHVLGSTDIDNRGISGFEKYIDQTGVNDLEKMGLPVTQDELKPFELSIDMRVQHSLRDELVNGIAKYKAIAGSGIVYDVTTGEILALASYPDFDANSSTDAQKPENINRAMVGVYEMGSTFKALNTALALESGKMNINSAFDTKEGKMTIGKHTIHEYHGTGKRLTIPEIFLHSSNLGSAKMALTVGSKAQQDFLRKMGILDRVQTELPETQAPLYPKYWSDISTVTISYGHGISVSALSCVKAVGALVNGGKLIEPTFLKRTAEDAQKNAPIVIKSETSEALRYVMRLNAEQGTAKAAQVQGYFIGGKTGTAEKAVRGFYQKDKMLTTFMAITPADKPRYLYFVILDEPKGIPETHNLATSSWNAGAVTGKLIERTAPMLMPPIFAQPEDPFPTMVRWNAWGVKKS